MKTIVVTGGAGFIGSHICERLARDGHRVISLDNYFTGLKDNHVPGVEYRRGHTKDIAKLIHETPDLIYHLGEYARTEVSLSEPALVWDLNIDGTRAVLDFWHNKKCKLVYAGSSTTLVERPDEQTPYAQSKAVNARLVRNYHESNGHPYAVVYLYNVYGPRERAGKYGTVIEIFRQRFLEDKSLTVTSPGTQRRIFTHIDDVVEGLVLIGEMGEGDGFALGADESYSIFEVARLFGGPIEMKFAAGGNRMNSKIDTKNSRALGWRPTRRLEDYIRAITHGVKLRSANYA
jgi:UDP-glucose 4-epimerase